MIFQRAIRRELMSTAGAVFTALFTIIITVMLIKILGKAAGGKIASADVIALIGFAALQYLPILLILTSFISVLMVVSRSYQDSEMVVWFASGVSLVQWIRPVVAFGWPIVLMTGLLSFMLTPLANRLSAESAERFEKREDILKISPGKFQESASSNRMFFVEGISGDASKVENIFVNTVENGKTSIIVAKEGTTEVDSSGDKFVIMRKGRRYDGAPNQSDFQMMEFERYGMLVSNGSQALVGDKSAHSMSTMTLLEKMDDAYHMSELLWRIALPLMCLLLMLLAIPLGFVNPRVGRSVNLMIALLLYVTYTNVISIFQAAVAQQKISFLMAWWPVHAFSFILIVLAFSWRLNVNSAIHPLVLWSKLRRACLSKRTVAP
ncbi:MAG: LPS export ABC transporter permease LptF [Pseudomonadota bacterium]